MERERFTRGGDGHLAGSVPLALSPVKHPIRIGQTFVLLICGFWEWYFTPPQTLSGVVTATVFMILLPLAGVFPVPANLALLLNFCVTCLFFHVEGPSQLLGVAYSLGTLTYDISTKAGVVLAIPVVCSLAIQSSRYPDFRWFSGYAQVPILILLITLLLFFSHTSRRHSLLYEAQRKIEEADALKRRVTVARIVHDSVTGDLSNIARIAQQRIRRVESEEDREAWRQINDRSLRVLDSVYAVIRQLSDEDETELSSERGRTDGRRFVDVLRERTDEWTAVLAQSGFIGVSRVIDHVHGPQFDNPSDIRERRACVLDMLDEAYANIVRHGTPGQEAFTVVVTVDKNQIEIVATNPLADDERLDEVGDPVDSPPMTGGHGLKMHRAEVERLGGVLSADAEDEHWILYVRVPRLVGVR
ncbi:Two-component sensor protein [Bifidobacterium lemurum]|uniref:Two-component sensor protein n=1 Tax=Bifidobacterium lemurum TaxID=1603886 RepID=A0A261FTR8_9BIFI|nr:hypothetical protein [Bifidobacterium lemurum]OZG62355.1 Two-component sensor protein [Bifidobacterium lemurum]QOL33715.1 hypothetical protein BL8807_07940 [Bifidobacterium lemurum]